MKKVVLEELLPPETKQVVVAGLSYGDEGKGKVADALYPRFTHAVGVNGGPNAGHNVIVNNQKIHFHELPGSAARAPVVYLGSGKVTNIMKLKEEINQLALLGHTPRVVLAGGAHVIVPAISQHLESFLEQTKSSTQKVGTTGQGIAPTYALKALRIGITVGELYYGNEFVEQKLCSLAQLFPHIDPETMRVQVEEIRQQLIQLVDQGTISLDLTNTYVGRLCPTEKVICECSQSVMLSLSGGQYPFVTSSECGFTAIPVHLNTADIGFKIGVTKAISSKVGGGRFPTEWQYTGVDSALIDLYRQETGEFGATTGRPRQIGFIDAVQLRHAFHTGNRPDLLWVNMADRLPFLSTHGLENKIATAYITKQLPETPTGGEWTDALPPAYLPLEEIRYTTLPAVKSERDYADYVFALKEVLSYDGSVVLGTGPGPEDNLLFPS